MQKKLSRRQGRVSPEAGTPPSRAPAVKSPRGLPLWAQASSAPRALSGQGNNNTSLPIQTSLKVNAPGDAYEQEADRVAGRVMRMPEPRSRQRTCACGRPAGPDGQCDACRQKQVQVRRKATGETGQAAAPPIVGRVLGNPGRTLDPGTRNFMESRFGHDFGGVRVHSDGQAAASAEAVGARAYTVGHNIVFGPGQYRPGTATGRKLLAHELAHVIQQRGAAAHANPHPPALQRDLALEPPAAVAEQPDLTEPQVQAAIRYNRASYEEASIRLIQDLVGVTQTGAFEEATVRAVAHIQERFGLKADGKVGPDTYDLLIRELRAEGTAPDTCLTLFQIVGPEPLRFFRNSATTGTIGSRFRIRARFDPRCKCEDFEYRQYIAGSVTLHDVSGVTQDASSRFTVPGGLRSTLHEDGDTTIPAGVAGHRYGHRRARPHPTDDRDRYLPDRPTGCEYRGHDFPELAPIPAAPGDAGDRYVWNMRFRGVIIRRSEGVVAEKYWSIRGTVTVP